MMIISQLHSLLRKSYILLVALLALAPTSAWGENAQYSYDGLGRLTGVTYSNGTTITYTYDPAGNRSQYVVVSSPNQPPNAVNDTSSTPINTPVTFDPRINDSDPNGGALTITAKTDGTKGTVSIGGGGTSLTYTPNTGQSGADSFTYTISDPNFATAMATVSMTITGSSSFNQTIQITGTGPVNLRSLADAAGYNGAQNATVTFQLANAVTITGAAGSGAAINTGSWPTGGYTIALSLEVSGKVRGGGGNGGNGGDGGAGQPGGQGGDGLYCSVPMSVTVNAGGEIKSGGGGGGGGGRKRTAPMPEPMYGGGAGGGGGQPNGNGGAGGVEDTTGQPGSPGTTSGPGAGGSTSTAGGSGGAYGASGTAGANGGTGGTTGGAGGVAGYAVRKNGNTVSVTNNGTIVGTVN
jgi:YD repeat-containing protein